MRTVILLTVMICGLALSGCANNTANPTVSIEPSQAEQATTPATSIPSASAPESSAPAASNEDVEQTPADSSTKQEYLAKLDAVKTGLSDLQSLKDEGTTASMTEAANEEYKRWDKALNEVYDELKKQLSENEMADLKKQQLDWISDRDEKAKKASQKYEGGTMGSLEYASTLASITKERCYELVNTYMK